MADEKPFYIRQLPKEAQDWLKDKAYKSFIADGDKEEDAQKKAEDFLDEKVYTAEEMYGKDFLKEVGKAEEPKYEVVNDKNIDAIKDSPFKDPNYETNKALSEIDTNDNGKIEKDEMVDFQKSLDDYASKNKKGRDDIPVTTRR